MGTAWAAWKGQMRAAWAARDAWGAAGVTREALVIAFASVSAWISQLPPTRRAPSAPLTLALDRARTRRRFPPPAARRRLRLRAGVTLAVIARTVGVSGATVSRWETGHREPTGAHLEVYAEVLARLAREVANRGGGA